MSTLPAALGEGKLAAATTDTESKSNIKPVTLPEEKVKPVLKKDGVELDQRIEEATGTLVLKVSAWQYLSPVDNFIVYPYPVKLPRVKVPLGEVPVDKKSLQRQLLTSGYSNRIDPRRPYPPQGWRWEMCYRRALSRSKLGEPHSILTMYKWADEMAPYILPEIQKVNAHEKRRAEQLKKMEEEFEASHTEIETNAINAGLFPMPLKTNLKGYAQVKLSPGNWWISGTRKVPGLTFYWQYPITVSEQQITKINLTDANALIIQGGW